MGRWPHKCRGFGVSYAVNFVLSGLRGREEMQLCGDGAVGKGGCCRMGAGKGSGDGCCRWVLQMGAAEGWVLLEDAGRVWELHKVQSCSLVMQKGAGDVWVLCKDGLCRGDGCCRKVMLQKDR